MGITPSDLQYFAPEILLALVAIVIFLLPRASKNIPMVFALGAIGLSFLGTVWFLFTGANTVMLFGSMEINAFSELMKLIFLVLAGITILGSYNYLQNLRFAKEYISLLLVATMGLMFLGSAGDFITLFVAFELVSISTYALPIIDQKSEKGKEAAIKYFVTGAFSSALILYGLSLLYGLTGSVQLSVVATVLQASTLQPILIVAMIFLLAGFGYKMAIVPFHLWAPDAYEGSPTPVSAFLAGITKKGAFVVVLKLFLATLIAIKLHVILLFAIIAALTMTIGNIVALVQNDMKRMLAYSSIAHAGNILVGLAIFTPLAAAGAIMHIVAHGLMAVGAFFGIEAVCKKKQDYSLQSFHGLGKSVPLLALGLSVILLSLAGVPPLLGFWSKMVIVISAFEVGGGMILLALILVLNSALSMVYYARLIKVMYMSPASAETAPKAKWGEIVSYSTALAICVGLLLLLGLFPNQLFMLCRAAVAILLP